MTNYEIIFEKSIEMGYTKEEVTAFYKKYGYLPFCTYGTWQENGRQVRKGEKAKFSCGIWQHFGKATQNGDPSSTEIEIAEKEEKTDEEMQASGFKKVNVFFFHFDQTEEMTDEDIEKLRKRKEEQARKRQENKKKNTGKASAGSKQRNFKHFEKCESMKDLNKQYRKLVKIYHPDNLETGDSNIIKEIYKEYGIIKRQLAS